MHNTEGTGSNALTSNNIYKYVLTAWLSFHFRQQENVQKQSLHRVYLRQMWFADTMTKIMKEDWILGTGTFVDCVTEK